MINVRSLAFIAPMRPFRYREEFRAPVRRTKVPEERTRGAQVALWGFRVLAPGGKLWCSVYARPGFALGGGSLGVFRKKNAGRADQDDADGWLGARRTRRYGRRGDDAATYEDSRPCRVTAASSRLAHVPVAAHEVGTIVRRSR
jgi:hypothetical protein